LYINQKFIAMLNTIPLHTGCGLIAEPFMPDPFKRAVILVTEHAEAGTMGFVLNHLSEYLLGDLLPDLPYSEIPVFIGGPVENETLHFIHCCPEKIKDGIEVTEGVFWGGDFDTVKQLITTYALNSQEIRFFSGYSGWDYKQLENEIQEDSWLVTNKLNKNTIFCETETNLWRNQVVKLGKRFAHIVNFPVDPSLN
jgi:putative transcriptional regulator